MRVFNLKVFDDMVSGTTGTWFSRSEFNGLLGQADAFAIQAVTNGVQGASPTLTILSQHSSDGQNWITTKNADQINGTPISEDSSCAGFMNFFATPVIAANMRFCISLGGTNPACRLKVYATGRLFPF